MSLRSIIGQDKTVDMLLGCIKRQRVASSYLFCGESGIGKKTTAINFAKALNCKGPGTEPQSGHLADMFSGMPGDQGLPDKGGSWPDACDTCDACLKITAGTHPDFFLISPEDRHIKIEDIRVIEDALSFKPFEGRKKVVIIDDAETMNISAANAFLKTLEEPPEDCVILLISSRPGLLPATVRSRCSRINFYPLSVAACREALEDKAGEGDLDLLVRLSMGRPGAVLSSDLIGERTRFLELFRAMGAAEKDSWTSREDMELWFDHVLVFLRDMAVLKTTGDASGLINTDQSDYMASLSKSLDLTVIIYLHREMSLLKRMLFFNLNKSITWNYAASLFRKELKTRNA